MTINFYIRASNQDKDSTIYLQVRNGRNFNFRTKTPFQAPAILWDKNTQRCINPYAKTTARSIEAKQEKKLIETINNNLSLFESELTNFLTINPNSSQEDIKNFINDKYFPKKEVKEKTLYFHNYIDQYIINKSKKITGKQIPITEGTKKRITTIRNTIYHFNKGLKIENINDNFRDKYTEWMQEQNYSPATIIKHLKYTKSICKHFSKEANINTDVLTWEFINEKVGYTPPTLSFKEIEYIDNIKYHNDYLENAKDWLIIGCYCGARVSDLLNFTKENIIDENLLKYEQQKIKNHVEDAEEVIFLHPKIIEILKRRDGNFPRKISDVKFNKYIKKVCQIAGLDELMKGGKIGDDNKKKVGIYHKWELVTSHIMRRSYVTNFSNILDKESFKAQTGHKTDNMVNHLLNHSTKKTPS